MKAMDKESVADILEEIGLLLELKGENPFKSRAYANAARIVLGLDTSLEELIREDRLKSVKGIGSGIREKIQILVQTGGLPYYEKLKESIPSGLLAMLEIPGMGPKKVKEVHDRLGIKSLEELEEACRRNRLASLPRMGAKTQEKILRGIEFRKKYASRHRLDAVWPVAEEMLAYLRAHLEVIRCEVAGSLRRWKETIGDLDFLCSSRKPARVIKDFVQAPGIREVSLQGDTKASVILEGGVQADLRVVRDSEYASALNYFTGSKEHNIVLRRRAIERGFRLSEYGLFRIRNSSEAGQSESRVECQTEAEIYRKLDLPYIPPEMREDAGEFELAEKGRIPRLLEWTDLRGSLHNHTTWSDGRHSLEETAAGMEELGCEYWAITDHSRASFQANGLTPERLRQQIRAVKEFNDRQADAGREFRLLTGCEVDILNQGKLDFSDEDLAELDVVVASIHSAFSQGEAEMTKRLVAAAENPLVHMLGHPSGRLLLEREPYRLNVHAVIDACAATGTWIELNASPYRFDLDWRLWPYAKAKGVKCVINCDAHRNEHAGFLRLGAGVARKGGLTHRDVINTLPLKKLRVALQQKRAK